ncbi:hypothetical protein [Nocardia africana]|uniref:Uncharacterized protein n=1 Tax=Nocardia africana TaxID=134964 RepID=A0A378WTR3_9NOCA|nr:hypothetical protein [Nocardia africana]MCC3313905.1 hypothetical protein [Nocardia africana]SUA44710.1 Uncharacterised protein [Nocardia africana]
MTAMQSGSDLDRADQSIPVGDQDLDTGLDTRTLHPLAERIRAAFDSAAITDRIDQNWITPYDDDDYYCLAY